MIQNQPLRVKSGLPWWLWAMLILATIVIGAGVIFSSVPDDPKQLYEQSLTEFSESDKEKFATSVARLAKFPEYASHVKLLEGMHASVQNRDPRALELFDEAIENPEIKPLVLQKIGSVKTRLGDYKGAITAYEEAIQLAPASANQSRVLLARLYYAVGALALAENTLNDVTKTEPENKDARAMLGRLKLDLNRHAEAVADYSAILSTPGDFAAASPAVVDGYTRCLLETKDTEKLKEISQNHMNLLEDMGLKAAVQLQLDDIDSIRTALAEAVQSDMAGPDVKIAASKIALAAGDLRDAENFLDDCLQMMPRDLGVLKTAVEVYEKTNQPEKQAIAQKNLDQIGDLESQFKKARLAITGNIDDANGRYELGRLSIELGRYPDGQKWFSIATAIDPEMAPKCIAAAEAAYTRFGLLVPFTIPDSTEASAIEKPAVETPGNQKTEANEESPKSADGGDAAVEKTEQSKVEETPSGSEPQKEEQRP